MLALLQHARRRRALVLTLALVVAGLLPLLPHPPEALRTLEQANEDFDFERAVLALDQLTSHLTSSRSEDAVL